MLSRARPGAGDAGGVEEAAIDVDDAECDDIRNETHGQWPLPGNPREGTSGSSFQQYFFHCEVCSMRMSLAEVMETHLRGERHANNLQIRDRSNH